MGLAVLAAPAAAQAAPTTFAQYTLKNGGTNDVTYTPGATGTGASTATLTSTNTAVNFSFLLPVTGLLAGPQDAHLTINLSTNAPTTSLGSFLSERFTSTTLNSITITRDTAIGGKTNLLSVFFGPVVGPNSAGSLAGQRGSTGVNLNASTNSGNTVTFTSDFIDFSNTSSRGVALALSSLISSQANPSPGLRNGLQRQTGTNYFFNNFTASSSGSFSSDPAPIIYVPEPSTVTLLGLGIVAAPVLYRRRRKAAAVVS